MTYKIIMVPVNTPEVSRPALETALRVARRFDAHLDVLHVRPDPRGLVPYTGEGMDGSMIEEIMEVTEREGGERATSARAMFNEFCDTHGIRVTGRPSETGEVTAAWREEVGREDEVVATRGRLYDLVVVGQPAKDAPLPSPITLEAALLDTGRPTLVAPAAQGDSVATRIALAWEGSPEAARAISDALPFLRHAEEVWVLAHSGAAPSGMEPEDLVGRLSWHGVRAEIHRLGGDIRDLGQAFLDGSAAVGADLLVKGAYSQSRLRQMILGGRTRHILGNTRAPVLLAH